MSYTYAESNPREIKLQRRKITFAIAGVKFCITLKTKICLFFVFCDIIFDGSVGFAQ